MSAITDAIELVRANGMAVVRAGEWLKLSEYRERLGLARNTISARLRHRKCPEFECEKGPTGRINWIRPHAALDAFLANHGKPRGRTLPNHER